MKVKACTDFGRGLHSPGGVRPRPDYRRGRSSQSPCKQTFWTRGKTSEKRKETGLFPGLWTVPLLRSLESRVVIYKGPLLCKVCWFGRRTSRGCTGRVETTSSGFCSVWGLRSDSSLVSCSGPKNGSLRLNRFREGTMFLAGILSQFKETHRNSGTC